MMRYKTILLDTNKSSPNRYITHSIYAALSRSRSIEAAYMGTYANAIQIARRNECNLFVAFGGDSGDLPYLSRLAKICGTSVLWTTEDPYQVEGNRRMAEYFTFIFTNDRQSVVSYTPPSHHLPLAGSLEFNYVEVPSNDEGYLYDIFFVGTAWSNRIRFLRTLYSKIGDTYRWKIGLSTNQFVARPQLQNDTLVLDWRTPVTEFCRLANRSRIVLSLPRIFTADPRGNSRGTTPPPRLFEVALAGAFQLGCSMGSETAHYFNEKTEIPHVESPSDAAEAIEYYIKNTSLRLDMARRAQSHAQSSHLYDHRIERMLQIVSGKQKKPRRNTKPSRFTNKRKVVLGVTHNVYPRSNYGGVEIYQRRLAQILSSGAIDYLFLFPLIDGDQYHLHLQSGDDILESHSFTVHDMEHLLRNGLVESSFERTLIENRVDLVHVHHLINHVPSLPFIASALGVPTVMTIQDFYVVCQRFNLLDYRNQYCDTRRFHIENCDICLQAAHGIPAGAQARRRHFFEGILTCVDSIVCNNRHTARYLTDVYPDLSPDKINVIPLMAPNNWATRSFGDSKPLPCPDSNVDTPLRVLVPGNFAANKGADDVLYVMNNLRDDPIEFVIMGRMEPHFASIFDQLNLPRVTMTGRYDNVSFLREASSFDISLHLSIWPETFCLTLSEIWAAGLIPIVTDIGALGERVSHEKNGFKVPAGRPGEVVRLLRRIQRNRELITSMRANITPADYDHVNLHVEKIAQLYNKLFSQAPVLHNSKGFATYRLDTEFLGITTTSPHWSTVEIVPLESAAQSSTGLVPVEGSGILHDFQEIMRIDKTDGSWYVDAVNGTSNGNMGSDEIKVSPGEELLISGWAVDRIERRAPDSVGIWLQGETDYYMEAKQKERADVSEKLGDIRYLKSGFDAYMARWSIPEGRYRLFIVCFTDRQRIEINTGLKLLYGSNSAIKSDRA